MQTTKIVECTMCNGAGTVTLCDSHRGRVYTYNRDCMICRGVGVKTIVVETPDTIEVGGFTVDAPGFTAESFDRAIHRAHDNGLIVAATDRPDMLLVTNPTHGTCYTVSRDTCTCRAGEHGLGCMHRALVVFLMDVTHDMPQATVAA